MLCLWIDSQSSLTGLCRFGPGYPALERPSGNAARTLDVPGYFQTRLSALVRSSSLNFSIQLESKSSNSEGREMSRQTYRDLVGTFCFAERQGSIPEMAE